MADDAKKDTRTDRAEGKTEGKTDDKPTEKKITNTDVVEMGPNGKLQPKLDKVPDGKIPGPYDTPE